MESVRIGLLHSQTGTMAFSESPLLDAEQMAIEIINSTGGILGCYLEPVIEDGASDPDTFSRKAYRLITEMHVATIFGGWNSHTRKAVKRVVEEHNALFWYPMQYEGLEESPNIFYTGSCLNQQIQPALDWCWSCGWRNCFLLGSDYIFPITANMLMKSILKYKGGNVAGEQYVPLGQTDFSGVIEVIRASRPHVVINTLNGDSNACFFKQYRESGFDPLQHPVLSTSVAEHECRQIGDSMTGHFACWNYFQSLDTPENNVFVKTFRNHYGADRVISDPIVMAYCQLFMWKQIVEAAGSFEVNAVRANARGQRFTTPAGTMTMMANHHLTKPQIYIGKVIKPGEFEIVWSNGSCSHPLPWYGVEELIFPSSYLVRDIMKVFPETVNFNAELEHQVKVRTQELAESEQRLQSVFETMMEGVVLISPEGEIVRANAEAERILGLERTEIIKRHHVAADWNAIRPDGSRMPAEEMPVLTAFREMKPVRNVVMGLVYEDRPVCWINLCATPFKNDEGKLEGVVVTFSDITESKRMWDELQKTQRLESLGLLAGGIAHDFNNLLGGVFGNLDMAIEMLDDKDRALNFLEKGISALNGAKDLTGQLLTFSKGGNPIKVTFAIEPLLRESIALSLSGSNVAWDVFIEPSISELDADPNQISQVLNNMILNARQAMPDGGTLTIYLSQKYVFENQIERLHEGEYVEIAIRDNGRGISDACLARIFDPFFTTRKQGTGLGLSMCHLIICKHNGTITVDSIEGEGTTFRIYLPAVISHHGQEREEFEVESTAAGRVLVMDDEEYQRDMITEMLELLGCSVVSARDGEDAIRLFRENMIDGTPFDLVMLDLTMQGGMGGVQVMGELRKLDPKIPGIVLSGYADSLVLARPSEYQFSGKIIKPFRRNELSSVVGSVLKGVRKV